MHPAWARNAECEGYGTDAQVGHGEAGPDEAGHPLQSRQPKNTDTRMF
jgi:hypothetical protein